jgi:palmitoyltransferase ZDHHC13/17
MLLVVQVIQISRAQTTYENMKSQRVYGDGHKASEAIASALVTGATLPEGTRPPVIDFDAHGHHGHGHHGHNHQEGWFSHMKKLFGLDTFVATAQDGLATRNRSRHDRNPFSRGIITNCKDFCCDPAPVFGKRTTGTAMLGGEVVNYAKMYERPSKMTLRPRHGNQSNGTYQSVPADDTV